MRAILPTRDYEPFGLRDHHLLRQLPPPELFALLFFGIAILLLLVTS